MAVRIGATKNADGSTSLLSNIVKFFSTSYLKITNTISIYYWGGVTPAIVLDTDLLDDSSKGFIIGSLDTLLDKTTNEVILQTGANEVAASTSNTGQLDLITGDITHSGASGSTGAVQVFSGSNNGTGNSGSIQVATGGAVDGNSGGFSLTSGVTSGTGDSGSVSLASGIAFGTGDSGNLNLITGAASGGTRGIGIVQTTSLRLDDTHLVTTQTTAPTIAPNAGDGSTGTASVGTGSTDVAGSITITPSGTGIVAGSQATLTFNKAYTNGTFVILTPANTNAAAAEALLGVYVTSNTTTFDLNVNIALTTGTAYVWNYQVIGR